MKKNLFFLVAIAISSLLAVSCGNKKTVETTKKVIPAVNYPGTVKTISDTVPVFKKKTYKGKICATGKEYTGTYWKQNGDSVISHTYVEQGPAVPADSLAAWAGNTTIVTDCDDNYGGGNTGGTNTGSNGSGFWRFFLNWLLPILLALIALILLIRGISWLINNWPAGKNNSSSKKTESMNNNSAADPNRIAALTTMISTLKGTDGTGKGMVKDGCLEMVVGEAKASVNIRIKNTGSGSVYVGDHMKVKLENSGNIGVNPEPKKEEPAAPGNQA